MAELADAQDLGSCEAIRVGSTPTARTSVRTNCASLRRRAQPKAVPGGIRSAPFVLPFKIATTMLGCDFVFLRAKCAAFRFRQQPKADAENCTSLPCPSSQNRTRLSWGPVLCFYQILTPRRLRPSGRLFFILYGCGGSPARFCSTRGSGGGRRGWRRRGGSRRRPGRLRPR